MRVVEDMGHESGLVNTAVGANRGTKTSNTEKPRGSLLFYKLLRKYNVRKENLNRSTSLGKNV